MALVYFLISVINPAITEPTATAIKRAIPGPGVGEATESSIATSVNKKGEMVTSIVIPPRIKSGVSIRFFNTILDLGNVCINKKNDSACGTAKNIVRRTQMIDSSAFKSFKNIVAT